MKNNLRRKMVLSAITLGVAALSVTATTYAWFTSSATATATNIAGKASSADANLLISTDTSKGYSTTLEFGTKTTTMDPVARYSNTGTYKTMTGVTDGVPVFKASTNVLSYTVYFYITNATAGGVVYAQLNDFVFSSDVTQALLASAGATAAGGSITDLGLDDVLCLDVIQDTTDDDTSNFSYSDNTAYRFLTETTPGDDEDDALTYYNNIFGTDLSRDDVEDSTDANGYYNEYYDFATDTLATDTTSGTETTRTYNSFKLGTVADDGDAYFAVTFNFFVDGWDSQCYNAIAGTSITSGAFDFTLSAS